MVFKFTQKQVLKLKENILYLEKQFHRINDFARRCFRKEGSIIWFFAAGTERKIKGDKIRRTFSESTQRQKIKWIVVCFV